MKKKLFLEALKSDSLKKVLDDLMDTEDYEVIGWMSRKLQSIVMPFIDIYEEDDYLVVVADMAGFKKEEIDIEVLGGKKKILIEGKRDKKMIDYIEDGRCSDFRKEIRLPYEVKTEGEATYENGVLEIRVEKKESETEEIEVK